MKEIYEILVREKTFLGKVIGYKKSGEDTKIYWALETKDGLENIFGLPAKDEKPNYVPANVLDIFVKMIRSK